MKMKKSKVIVPALALLLLSTAASVSGTVAWFTANNTADVTASNFTVTSLDGALAVVCAAGFGTTKVSDEAVQASTNVKLADASFNHLNTATYGNSVYTDTLTANVYQKLGAVGDANDNNWKVNATTYYAVSWTMTFTYTFGADYSTDMHLYLNTDTNTVGNAPAGSYLTKEIVTARDSEQAAEGTESWKGFRIAFINGTTARKVWAGDNCTLSTGNIATRVAGRTSSSYICADTNEHAGGSAVASYTSSEFMYAGQGLQTSATVGGTASVNYLGSFHATQANQAVNLAITCVAWFEGTDAGIVNGTEMDTVSAALKFMVRKNG